MTFSSESALIVAMNNSASPPLRRADASGFFATVWPSSSPDDSELQRRRKQSVRSGHLAMIAMVVAAVGGTIVADFPHFSVPHLCLLLLTGLAYIFWSLQATQGTVRLLLWDQGARPAQPTQVLNRGPILYFAIQLTLAGAVYHLGDQGRNPTLVWLALLPPIAHSVFLLERRGISIVSAATVGIFVFNVVRSHGWKGLPYALLAFSFAVLFTLIFSMLAVSSERARGEVQQLAGELSEANRKLREYAVQVEELAATRERNRLAREIHDSLGHYLTVVNVQLEAARAVLARDPATAQQALTKAQHLTQEGLQEIRRSVATLRSSPLDNKSLCAALEQLTHENQSAGVPTVFQVLGQPRRLSPQTELTLYRAGQEALTNIRKHARATRASLKIDFQASSKVLLQISDDGQGAAADAQESHGFGLLGLRERTQLLGGALRIQTSPGKGFVLEMEVPG